MKILVAEDDHNLRRGLAALLEREGYTVLTAANGRDALDVFQSQAPEFVCLDIMMPGLDGYELCKRFRKSRPGLPIIFISAKSEEIDKVLGLELGADDFITKPFGTREVLARIRAVTRRCLAAREPDASTTPFTMDDLEIRPAELRAMRPGEPPIDLSLRDVAILRALHARRGQAVDRATLFREAWSLEHVPMSRTLDQHVSQLRKRIERDPQNPQVICTVHGVGYRFD